MRPYRLLIFATLLFGCVGGAAKDSGPSEFDFLTLQWEATGAVPSDVRICELLSSGEPIALESAVVLGLQHFVSARVVSEQAPSLYKVEVDLTPEGRRRLKQQTSENVGRQLAIVIEGEVVALPTVMAPMDTSAIPLMPVGSLELADSLAGLINSAIASKAGSS